MGEPELHDEIGKLHEHIGHVSNQVKEVKHGQDALHREHVALRDRVDSLEHKVAADVAKLAAHEKEAEIYRGHMLEGLNRLTSVITKLDDRFDGHERIDLQERAEIIKHMRTTIRSIILAAVTFFATGAVLLWQTGVLA